MKDKKIRLDNLGNANDFDYHKKSHQNTLELMMKSLIIYLDAQHKRISDIDYKRKERNTLSMKNTQRITKLSQLRKQKRV